MRLTVKGVPPRRGSREYCLIARGRHYPPKYVLSRAHFHQSGKALKGFKGGRQTNDELRPHYNREVQEAADLLLGRKPQRVKVVDESGKRDDDLRDYFVAERLNAVHPVGYPISHSTKIVLNLPFFC
jgi:hypothetical protein